MSAESFDPMVAAPRHGRWQLHRRAYGWVLSWAHTPHGSIALFGLAFAESSFFPIPPDVLLIALVMGRRKSWLKFAALCTAGSVAGGIAGYYIGFALMESVGTPIIKFYQAEQHFSEVKELYLTYDFWIVFAAAFTPIPYKVFTITSGAMAMNLAGFAAVSAVGRGARFFLVAVLLYWFGAPMQRFIERYFDWLALAFAVLLIGGFVILAYF